MTSDVVELTVSTIVESIDETVKDLTQAEALEALTAVQEAVKERMEALREEMNLDEDEEPTEDEEGDL
jgi:hypothetical protein